VPLPQSVGQVSGMRQNKWRSPVRRGGRSPSVDLDPGHPAADLCQVDGMLLGALRPPVAPVHEGSQGATVTGA
jgi:hypothetical protein